MNPGRERLVDRFGRIVDYVRYSVTDRCDLRCQYCIPEGYDEFERRENCLSSDEAVRIIGAFSALGVKRVRLTGGEPLVRRDIVELAERLAAIPGIEDLSLSTNATQLARLALPLKRAGIRRINVSLDSLQPQRIHRITGRDVHTRIIDGLLAARDAGLSPIKINMVVMAGVNDDEIDDMVAFCITQGFVLRLIEAMPMGYTGRAMRYLDVQSIRARLVTRFELVDAILSGGGPARYLKTRDGALTIGFITPISQHFCATCNRVRMAVDGALYTCLGQPEQVELRPLLRAGCSDADLHAAIRAAIDLKPERHEFREEPTRLHRIMARTGG